MFNKRLGYRRASQSHWVEPRELKRHDSTYRIICWLVVVAWTLTNAVFGKENVVSKNEPKQKPRVKAHKVEGHIKIDGLLDEADWEKAEPGGPLYKYDFDFGQPMSEPTEFRILFSERDLYIGIWCYDSSPEGIVARAMERDSTAIFADDYVYLALDTFHDQRNGYIFALNPNGSRYDSLLTSNIFRDANWDGAWEAQCRVDEEGWKVEIRIPLATLSFNPDGEQWGFNISRTIGRKRERGRWTGALPQLHTYHVSEAGDITGFDGLKQGLGFEAAPYILGRYNQTGGDTDLSGDYGLDLRYRITPGLSSTLSYNTDFAETEVDNRQLNFTRFPLFFPERRAFFLEDGGVWEFGGLPVGGRTGLGLSRPLIPFFSRRIGRSSNGEIVPLTLATKIAGRVGDYTIGITDVIMDDTAGGGHQNIFAGRVSKNVFEQSSVGIITTFGDPNSNESNFLFGPDYRYRTTQFLGDKTLQVNGFALGTNSGDETLGTGYAYGGNVTYPNDVVFLHSQMIEVSDDFNPAMGFVRRKDIRAFNALTGYRPRPAWETVRQINFWYDGEFFTNLENRLESVTHRVTPLNIEFETGDELFYNYSRRFEGPEEDFRIAGNGLIPAGDYWWDQHRAGFELTTRRKLALDLAYSWGEFYGGTRQGYETSVDVRAWKHLILRMDYSFNRFDLPTSDPETHLLGMRGLITFTPNLAWSNLVQYDSLSESVGYNSRVQWEYRPGSKLFAVLNQNFLADDLSFELQGTEVTVKLGALFRF